jgi:hypothetical protein
MPVFASGKRVIGKDSNEWEQAESGLIDVLDALQTIYRQNCSELLRERLRPMTIKEAMALTISRRRQVMYLRSGSQ